VTASRMDADLQSVPTSVTVVSSSQIDTAPATNIGDLLRLVPGLNVVQTSAREITWPAARPVRSSRTPRLRSLTADHLLRLLRHHFLGPRALSSTDIKQIEVVRGPASLSGSQCHHRRDQHHHQVAA